MTIRSATLPLCLALAAAAFGAAAQEQAGVSAAVRGEVQFAAATGARAAVVGRRIASGEPVFMGDRIGTGPAGSLQLMLLDETTLTIGPNSSLFVDTFVYDPARGSGKLSIDVTRGAFRFISGRIARNEPRDVEIKTPAGTIGIRGTIVVGRVEPNGRVLAVLAGPGTANNVGAPRGGFDFTSGGTSVSARQPGWGVVAEPGRALQSIKLSAGEIDALQGQLAPPPGGAQRAAPPPDGNRPPPPGNDGGQARARGADNLALTKPAREEARAFDAKALVGNQAALKVLERGASWSELRQVTAGSATFTQTGQPLVRADLGTVDGSFDFSLSVNFGARTLNGGFTNINVPSQNVTGASLTTGGTINYANRAPNDFAGQQLSATCSTATCSGNFTFLNDAGTVGNRVRAFLRVESGGLSSKGTALAVR